MPISRYVFVYNHAWSLLTRSVCLFTCVYSDYRPPHNRVIGDVVCVPDYGYTVAYRSLPSIPRFVNHTWTHSYRTPPTVPLLPYLQLLPYARYRNHYAVPPPTVTRPTVPATLSSLLPSYRRRRGTWAAATAPRRPDLSAAVWSGKGNGKVACTINAILQR